MRTLGLFTPSPALRAVAYVTPSQAIRRPVADKGGGLSLWKSAVTALTLIASVQIAPAQETKLFFTSMSPAGSQVSNFFRTWIDRVNQQAGGDIKVELRDGLTLANFGNVYERVLDDVVQIGWVAHALVAGKFPLSEVTTMPFIGDNNEACSAGLWRMYKSGFLDAEYKDIVPLWMGCLGPVYLHWSKVPRSLDDLTGLKIRASGSLSARLVQLLGATPVSLQPTEMYEALQRGTIDAVVTGWSAFEPYKLAEVTQYHLELPLGISSSMHIMSQKKLDSLSARAQQVLRTNSGEEPSREMGAFTAALGFKARDLALASGKHQLLKLTPEQLDGWKKKAQPAIDEWVAQRQNGQQAIELFKKYYAESKVGQ
jgi:TRAP-type transport system periplasmic protein